MGLCALAPFLNIVSLFGGGLATIGFWSGKFVLAASLACLGGALWNRQQNRNFGASALAGMIWGTIMSGWALYIIYRIQALPSEAARTGADALEQGLGALLATQISPGAGTYFALLGGLAAAGTFGYLYGLSKSRTGRVDVMALLPLYGAALVLAVVVGWGYGKYAGDIEMGRSPSTVTQQPPRFSAPARPPSPFR